MYGFREGINNYYNLEALPVAVIGTTYYKQLEAGDTERAKGFYNLQVDFAIDGYIWYDEHGNSWLSNIFLQEHLNSKEDYIQRLVNFRTKVPSGDVRERLEGEIKENYILKADKRNALLSHKAIKSQP